MPAPTRSLRSAPVAFVSALREWSLEDAYYFGAHHVRVAMCISCLNREWQLKLTLPQNLALSWGFLQVKWVVVIFDTAPEGGASPSAEGGAYPPRLREVHPPRPDSLAGLRNTSPRLSQAGSWSSTERTRRTGMRPYARTRHTWLPDRRGERMISSLSTWTQIVW